VHRAAGIHESRFRETGRRAIEPELFAQGAGIATAVVHHNGGLGAATLLVPPQIPGSRGRVLPVLVLILLLVLVAQHLLLMEVIHLLLELAKFALARCDSRELVGRGCGLRGATISGQLLGRATQVQVLQGGLRGGGVPSLALHFRLTCAVVLLLLLLLCGEHFSKVR